MMNKPRGRKNRRAHNKAKCWAKPVHAATMASSLRMCPHGVLYTVNYDMFGDVEKKHWTKVDDFFIQTGCYDW